MRASGWFFPLLVFAFSVQCVRADVNQVYTFEDNRDPTALSNLNGGVSLLRYSGESAQTTKECKFGTGSMLLKEGKSKSGAVAAPGLISRSGNFSAEIHKMTFTTWILPATTNTNLPLIQRIPKSPYVHAPAGSFQFGYSKAYHCLFCKIVGKDGQIMNVRSPALHSILGGLWVQLGFTFDEGSVIIYVNGLEVCHEKSSAITSIPALPEGSMAAFNKIPDGYVDDFGLIFDRALTAEEMDQVYTSGLAKFITVKPSQ